MIRLTVHGKPIPKGRPRLSKWGTYTPKTTVQYEKLIRDTFILSGQQKLNGGVIMELQIYFKIPKSFSKKLRNEFEGKYHLGNVDTDNVIKSVADSLNGIAYDDDGQICRIEASKYWSDEPRIELKLYEVEE